MQNPDPRTYAAADAPLAASAALRETMVERQIRTFDVTDAGVLARMGAVPRELFVDPALAPLAYSDACLTATGQAPRELTAPLILARLLKEASLQASDRVLVVASGSGYAVALIAGLVAKVVGLDPDAELNEKARANCAALGLTNVQFVTGPLEQGALGPFDLILVDGVSQGQFDTLFSELEEGGRLVAIVSERAGVRTGKAVLFKRADGHVSARNLFDATAGALAAFNKPAGFVF